MPVRANEIGNKIIFRSDFIQLCINLFGFFKKQNALNDTASIYIEGVLEFLLT